MSVNHEIHGRHEKDKKIRAGFVYLVYFLVLA
jgi:hypothetical protein